MMTPVREPEFRVKASPYSPRLRSPKPIDKDEETDTMLSRYLKVQNQVSDLHHEFQNVLKKYQGDLYLVQMLQVLNLLPNDI